MLSQGCSPCNDNGRTPPALTERNPDPIQLGDLWEYLPQQTQQAIFNALAKMLDQVCSYGRQTVGNRGSTVWRR